MGKLLGWLCKRGRFLCHRICDSGGDGIYRSDNAGVAGSGSAAGSGNCGDGEHPGRVRAGLAETR